MAVLIMGLSDIGFCVFCCVFQHFSSLFVRTYVCVVYDFICMSLVVCWLFLKWYVDSREVLCFTPTFI